MSSEAASWEPVRKVRTHEQVLARIEEKILDGSLRAGEKLPSERDLVAALGVSRTSVREALRVLEAMGIIEANVGSGRDSGSIVTGQPTAALTSLLRLHLALAKISLADLVETRVQLERSAARDAALRRTPEDVTGLQEVIDAMRVDDLEYQQFNALDTEFHVRIAKVSGNALTATLMEALRGAVESEMTAVFQRLPDWRSVAAALVDEHAEILAAIDKGDSEGAADTVGNHISTFYKDQILGPS